MGAEATTFEAPNSIQANDENREFPPEPYDLALSKALAFYRYNISLPARGATKAACYGGTERVLAGEEIPIHPLCCAIPKCLIVVQSLGTVRYTPNF